MYSAPSFIVSGQPGSSVSSKAVSCNMLASSVPKTWTVWRNSARDVAPGRVLKGGPDKMPDAE